MQLNAGEIRLELKVTGYEFTEDTDASSLNWLMVQLDLQTPWGHWQRQDPCLETFEVQRLFDWLKEVERNFDFLAGWNTGNLDTSEMFIEPNLEFHVRAGHLISRREGAVVLEVRLSHEFLPPFASKLPSYEDPEVEPVYQVYLRFDLTLVELGDVIEQWKNNLEAYPVRKFHVD